MKREEAIYCLKAQSERYSEVCEECPLYGQTGVDHCCEDALQMAITALQNQPVWIPVSERLPEKDNGYYPINIVVFDTGEVCIGVYRNESEEWWTRMNEGETLYGTDHVVVAWMPLQEPYRESEKRMANRNTLHSNKLDAFRKWLIKTGWTIEEPKGIWEVLRAKKAGRQNPLIVYQKMNKEHLSVLDRDIDVIKRFLQEK